MSEQNSPKSGSELVASFFEDLKSDETLNAEVVAILVDLHVSGKLTNTNIANKLRELREGDASVKN